MKRMLRMALALAVIGAAQAQANGLLIPKDETVPPLAIKHQRVDIRLTDGVAHAKIEQVFANSTDRDLEATYVFPLPAGASIADFAMYIDGKRMSGELVEKDKARRIYEDIVRRMKDPGLLEHLGNNVFRVSVFPVPRKGEQKFELEYSQPLEFESGLYRLAYPLKTGEKASRLLEDFTLSVRLHSSQPIRTVYSPSHQIGVTRKGENEAVIGFEEERAMLDRDFELFYGVSRKDFGLNLLTHTRDGEDGFFMMMIAPSVVPPGGAPIAKDVVFAFDTSGSMAGKKIEQARKALEYCVRRLNDGDRFNIVRFSTDLEEFQPKLVEANAKNRDAALAFAAAIEARGGTAIHDALQKALAMDFDRTRPNFIVFLTDGRPTIGETDTEGIAASLAKSNGGKTRLFAFGVGDEVNTVLLDKLAGGNGGVTRYVRPEEDIEIKVSSLADKISQPVLSRPVVTVDKIKTLQVHPRDLPDLFAGEQITVLGRYQGDGHVAIRLTGEVNGTKREFVYEDSFPPKNADNDFVPRLWATRRVGYLLEEIRLHGDQKELEDEVIRLGKQYGIMTPYTSYLVLENEQAYRDHGVARQGAAPIMSPVPSSRPSVAFAPAGGAAGAPAAESAAAVPMFDGAADSVGRGFSIAARKSAVHKPDEALRMREERTDKKEAQRTLGQESGGRAVNLSVAIQEYKQQDRLKDDMTRVRHVGERLFYLVDGTWVDGGYKEGGKEVRVPFAGEAYFKLLAEKPELKAFFALGEKVIACLGGVTYIVE